MRKSNVTDDEVGRIAWDTYSKAVGGKAFNGDPLPTWDVMCKDEKKENLVVAWKRAARAVAAHVEKKTPDLSHLGTGSIGVVGASSPPFAVSGAVSGRMSSADGPNLSSLPAVSSMPPPIRQLKTRTKCCGSQSMSLILGGNYACPCGDTVLTPEAINEKA
jgi:hypothetical protein